ncbi:MAG: hypothetical protein V1838_05160 [Patescibacteria group bacterium]
MAEENQNQYNEGEDVHDEGHYVCVPCGYRQHLKSGDKFPACVGCLDREDQETAIKSVWEKIDK